MKKIIIALLLSCLVISAFAQEKILTFATDDTYPPFEYYDAASNSTKGFDIDIVIALCQQMKVKCQLVTAPFTELLPRLKTGKYSAVIRAMSITPARSKIVDFTVPYFNADGSFMALASSNLTLTPKDLARKNIAVQQGTTFEDYVKRKYGKLIVFKPYVTIGQAIDGLRNGEVALVLADTPILQNFINANKPDQYKMIGKTDLDATIFGAGFGIAVKKGNKSLLNALNQALQQIKANGTYDRITTEYFEK